MRRPVEPVAKSVCFFLKFFRISLPISLILFSCDHEATRVIRLITIAIFTFYRKRHDNIFPIEEIQCH